MHVQVYDIYLYFYIFISVNSSPKSFWANEIAVFSEPSYAITAVIQLETENNIIF